MIKPIPDWLSDDGKTSKYQCVICGTNKSVKYAIYSPDPDDKAFLPHCNKCILKFYNPGGSIMTDGDKIITVNDELWKIKEKCLDIDDPKVGQILYQLCRILQDAIVGTTK